MSTFSSSPSDPLAEAIKTLAEESIEDTDLFLVGVEIRGFQGSRVVQVTLDSDAGVELDELAEMSQRLSFLLDTEDIVKGHYRLDVTSPGADEPLQLPRQYPRNVGRSLEVRFDNREGEEAVTTGELTSATDNGITIKTDDGNLIDISYDTISEARVMLPW